jgi:hypothetical protein
MPRAPTEVIHAAIVNAPETSCSNKLQHSPNISEEKIIKRKIVVRTIGMWVRSEK